MHSLITRLVRVPPSSVAAVLPNSVGQLALLMLAGMALLSPPAMSAPLPHAEFMAQTAPATAAEADRLLRRGAQQFEARQLEAALATWQQALAQYRQAGDRQGEGRVLGNLAAVYQAQGKMQQAIAFFQQSLEIGRALNDPEGISFALNNLGYVYTHLGQYTEAVPYLEEALALTRNTQDVVGQYHALNDLGTVSRYLGNYERSIELFQQSLAIARRANSASGSANALGNLGNTYTDQGNYPLAFRSYDESLNLMRQSQDRVGEAGVLQRLGMLYAQLGNYDRAAAYYTQSLAIAREIEDRRIEAYNLAGLGVVYYNQEDPEQLKQALIYLQTAIGIMQQLGDRANQGKMLNSLGNAYAAQLDYVSARRYYQQSLEIAREIGDRNGEGLTLGSLALTYDLTQDDAQAVALYRQAIAIVSEVGDRLSEGRAWSNLGMALYEMGKLEQSAEALLTAVGIWESLRPGLSDTDQVSLFETQAATYRVLQRVLIELKRYDEALEISERGRARAFVELVAQRFSVQTANRFQVPVPTVNEIRQIARQQNATLVQYTMLDGARLAIWVIQPNGTIHFRETALDNVEVTIAEAAEQTRVAAALGRGGAPNPMTDLVRGARTSLAEEPILPTPELDAAVSERRMNRQLRSLHHLLIEPIADLLPTDPTDQVIFMPHNALFLVPFAALQDENKTFLIEQHTIRTSPSIQVLGLTHERRSQMEQNHVAGTSLVVGNPTMPRVGDALEPLAALPNAEQEARTIAGLLHTEAIVGSQATEETVASRMNDARIIHLATHGLLDDFIGLGVPGALALTPTPQNDGLLTANEILDLSLNHANLVVLSACDTGRGRITGDGVIGLSRSFISAGAPSVVVSLWSVPDNATAALMTTFYQNLQREDMNKAQALRQAMLATMQQYPSSRDWAAFTLLGESD